MNALVYDIEIVNAIPPKGDERLSGLTYCDGWHDYANMGISVIGAYDYAQSRYRVFCEDNRAAFHEVCHSADLLVSFNGLAFDNPVIRACWFGENFDFDAKCYDVLVEQWAAAGLGATFRYPTHAGFGLDATCERTLGLGKTGNGALAPVQWQRGEIGAVIDYCLNDVFLTKLLFDRVLTRQRFIGPNGLLQLRVPTRELA